MISLLVFETLLLLYEGFVITLLVFEIIDWNLNYVYDIELGYCFSKKEKKKDLKYKKVQNRFVHGHELGTLTTYNEHPKYLHVRECKDSISSYDQLIDVFTNSRGFGPLSYYLYYRLFALPSYYFILL